ncbi:MAG: SBBP repeat-containing protein, partial [Planctomycetes bacterium]|nr:SBBP repeat-containing protein [Planctomycetota bacterium]
NDLLLVKCDPSGKLLYIKQIGTELNDYGWGIAADHSGNVYVTGHTEGSFGAPIAGGDDIFLAKFGETCYADCDMTTGRGTLDIFDFLCFQNSFVLGEPYACDCDPDPVCDIFDFLCFQNAFVAGCP